MRRIIILAIIVAVAGSAGAATYYVDSVNGLDDASWSGGPGDPWRTITYALSRVSGANTFMCRGEFEEGVIVTADDDDSVFVANSEALLNGFVKSDDYVRAMVEGFDIRGYAESGGVSSITVRNCVFVYPEGTALRPGRFHGGAGAYYCVFEECGNVATAGGLEYGGLSLVESQIINCLSGVGVTGGDRISVSGCNFYDVEDTAVHIGLYEGVGGIYRCLFRGCGKGPSLWVSGYGYGSISECEVWDNGLGMRAGAGDYQAGELAVSDNVVVNNRGNGAELVGDKVTFRNNVIKNNGGHGVYISYQAPDLGTPKDPGRNVFAGNKSGYDVYNGSQRNIPAYGNTWDPQSEREMKGKTWKTVNVTRIYDHWDDPKFGYVMWSEPVAVEPASLGRIKASFGAENGPEQTNTAPMIDRP